MSTSPTERIWGKFRITHFDNGCWEWTGSRDNQGYGRVRHGKRLLLAHRLMWSVANCEEIPDGLDILHRCDNPPCVNPNHLYAGTHLQNMRDRDSRGRRRPPYGEQNASAKLNADQVRDIRARLARGENQYALAAKYGVRQATISSIHLQKSWRHV